MASVPTPSQLQPKLDYEPVSQHQNQNDPLAIFPELVWVSILAKLKGSPEHLHNLLEAYPSLRSYLHRPTWCFDVVIWNVSKCLYKSDLLSCLHTCSWWRYSVNRFLEHISSDLSPHGPQNERHFSVPHWVYAPFIELNGQQDLVQFQQSTASYPPHHNPFIGRAIAFKSFSYYPEYWCQFYSLVHSILEKFGSHLWHVALPIFLHSKHSTEYPSLYLAFRKCLCLLPNIRNLRLLGPLGRIARSTNIVQDVTILEQVFQQNPFPNLAHLCTLDVYDLMQCSLELQKEIRLSVINPLLEKYLLNGTLGKMVISSSLINSMDNVSTKFGGIRQVHLLNLHSGSPCSKQPGLLKALELKLADQWPDLEKLLIDSWNCRYHSLTELWGALFFLGNLKSLWVSIYNIEDDFILKDSMGHDILESSHDGILRNATLPWLKSLTIKMVQVIGQDLLKVRTEMIRALLERTLGLEYLKILLGFENEYKNEGGLRTGLQLAWYKLPKLKELRIGNRVFLTPEDLKRDLP